MKQSPDIIILFDRIIQDKRMQPSHVSLYLSLFQLWSMSTFQNPFKICRKDVMNMSKIKSFATYHKCMSEIHNAEFINYSPSYDSYAGSLIEIIDMENKLKSNNYKISKFQKKQEEENNFSIPVLYDIELYFKDREMLSDDAKDFYTFYQSRNWKLYNNRSMKCWRSAARNWISKIKMVNQNQKNEKVVTSPLSAK